MTYLEFINFPRCTYRAKYMKVVVFGRVFTSGTSLCIKIEIDHNVIYKDYRLSSIHSPFIEMQK